MIFHPCIAHSFKYIFVSNFDTKIYLNFSNFRGQVSDGGIDKIFARWGETPQFPQEKKKTLG